RPIASSALQPYIASAPRFQRMIRKSASVSKTASRTLASTSRVVMACGSTLLRIVVTVIYVSVDDVPEAQEALASAIAARRLAIGVAHDFNNALTSISA